MGDFSKLSDEKLGKMLICLALDDNINTEYYKQLEAEALRRSKK